MSKSSGRSSNVNDWIKKLKSRGIETYTYRDLPEDLKNIRGHRKAISEQLVERIGKKAIGCSIWRIKQDKSKIDKSKIDKSKIDKSKIDKSKIEKLENR